MEQAFLRMLNMCKKWPVRLISVLVIIVHFVDVNKKIQAIFIEFLNVIDISFTF